MNDLLDGKFYASISTEPIKDKNAVIWGNITYQKQFIRLSDLRNYIANNYAFCGVFIYDIFSVKDKTEVNWKSTNIISIDLDNRQMSYNDFIDIIKDTDICPNLAYRTANDGIKGNRYRLLYVLDDAIINTNLYNEIYWGIVREIERITNDRNDDNCMQSVVQQICGTIHTNDIYYNDLYYDIKCFKNMFNIKALNIEEIRKRNPKKIIAIKKEYYNFDFSEYDLLHNEFADDYTKLSYKDIINKYINLYVNYEQTQLEEQSDDTAYIEIPSNYCAIKRYWYLEDDAMKKNKCDKVRKISDGMQRRKKLYVNAIIRRLIYPQISFDNLLFNLIYEFHFYMVNNGNTITKNDLFFICQRAFSADLNSTNTQKYIIGNKDKEFFVNPLYCIKHNISKKAAVRIAQKQRTYNKIGELYDISKTDKQNVEILQGYDVKVSLRTLKRWKEENGLTNKRKSAISNYKDKREKRNISVCNDTFLTDNNISYTSNIMNTESKEERNNYPFKFKLTPYPYKILSLCYSNTMICDSIGMS